MRSIVLIAAVPLLLTACNLDSGGNNTTASKGPEAVPDEITVNGVVYVRADRDKIPPASATPTPASPSSLFSSPTSDSGASVPANTGTSGAAADHGQ